MPAETGKNHTRLRENRGSVDHGRYRTGHQPAGPGLIHEISRCPKTGSVASIRPFSVAVGHRRFADSPLTEFLLAGQAKRRVGSRLIATNSAGTTHSVGTSPPCGSNLVSDRNNRHQASQVTRRGRFVRVRRIATVGCLNRVIGPPRQARSARGLRPFDDHSLTRFDDACAFNHPPIGPTGRVGSENVSAPFAEWPRPPATQESP